MFHHPFRMDQFLVRTLENNKISSLNRLVYNCYHFIFTLVRPALGGGDESISKNLVHIKFALSSIPLANHSFQNVCCLCVYVAGEGPGFHVPSHAAFTVYCAKSSWSYGNHSTLTYQTDMWHACVCVCVCVRVHAWVQFVADSPQTHIPAMCPLQE